MTTYPLSTDREVLAEAPEYLVELHYSILSDGERMPFLHLAMTSPTSPRILRELKDLWGRLQYELPPIVFASATVDDSRITKLARWFGFNEIGRAPCSDGTERRIFTHFRKETP